MEKTWQQSREMIEEFIKETRIYNTMLEKRVRELEIAVAVLSTKILIYSAICGAVGSVIAAVVTKKL